MQPARVCFSRDFYLDQGIDFINFCLKQGIFFLDDKQPARMFYEFIKQGIRNRNSVGKISNFCLKQCQGMRRRAAPPHPMIYRVPTSAGERVNRLWLLKGLIKSQATKNTNMAAVLLFWNSNTADVTSCEKALMVLKKTGEITNPISQPPPKTRFHQYN